MRAQWTLLFAGLALAAGGVVFVTLRGPTNAESANATNWDDAERSAPSLANPADAAPSSSRALAVQRTDALAPEWNDASHDVVGPVIEGTIVVTDRDGGTHDAEDGAFVPDFIDGDDADLEEGERRHVAVKHGCFRFDARHATVMLVGGLELGGRAAAVDRGVEFAAGAPLAIAARWVDDALLHVVDATTHAELADVTVAKDRSQGSSGHPGLVHASDVAVDHAHSPFHLTRENLAEKQLLGGSIWIGASGHVWQSVTIDFGRELERTIELAAAGALVVTVTEPADPAVNEVEGLPPLQERAPRLRLRNTASNESGTLIADVPAHPTEFTFEGLAPGELVASLEVGEPFPSPLIVSRAAVTIGAGATSRATLALDLSKAPAPTTLAGTLYMPPAWGDTRMQIDLVQVFPLRDLPPEAILRGELRFGRAHTATALLEPIRNRPRWHAWSISPILPATYAVRVERAGFGSQIEVGPDGRSDVVLTLPEPALLRVRVVDAETQAEIEVERLTWNPGFEPGSFDRRSLRTTRFDDRVTILKWDPESARCIGAVRPGRGRITGMAVDEAASDLAESGEDFTVETGTNELVVRGHLPCGIDLVVVQRGAKRLPIMVSWEKVEASGSESSGRHGIQILHGGDAEQRIVLPGPGRYRLAWINRGSDGAGSSFQIDVPKGEFVKRTVEVESK